MNRGVVGIGIATMDIYLHHRRMYPGGNEYNIAYNAKRLGVRSGFMGIFANDKVGELLQSTLIDAGVDISHSHHEVGSSGYALVNLVDGERVFLDWNKKGVTDLYPFEFTIEEIEYIRSFDIACISWGARVSPEKIRMLAGAGVPICYDFYDNFTEREISCIAPFIRLAFFSGSHLTNQEIEEVLKGCLSHGCELAVVTRGCEAAIAYDGKTYYEQPIVKVKATDTMGAGDSFISAFVTNYFSECEQSSENKIKQSLKAAAEFAATVVVKDGSLGIGYEVDPERLDKIINL
ncbi:MAG: PfkB family carbohydrate kinase [Eubacteriales bacterium]|nr:PfkB family carbohydrate kinase [Eubacteriales bacterium]